MQENYCKSLDVKLHNKIQNQIKGTLVGFEKKKSY